MSLAKIEPQRLETLKRAGYTKLISYELDHAIFGWVESYFPTTDDAVEIYQTSLKKNPKIRNLQVEVI